MSLAPRRRQRNFQGFKPINTLDSSDKPDFKIYEEQIASADMVNQREPPRLFSPDVPRKHAKEQEEDFALPRIPSHLQGQDSASSSQAPTFGQASPIRNPLRSAPNVSKRHDPLVPSRPGFSKPEHHRAPVKQPYFNAPQFNPANAAVQRAQAPQAGPSVPSASGWKQPAPVRHSGPVEDAFEITAPANSAIPTIPAAAKPSFSTKSGFKPVNAWKGQGTTYIDLSQPAEHQRNEDDAFDPNKALQGGGFGAHDAYDYVDSSQANDNIKALLEGAFEEDDDDKPKTRLRRRKARDSNNDSAADQLAEQAKKLSVKDESRAQQVETEEDEEEDDGSVDGLSVKLLPHQVDGVAWMVDRESGLRKKNGVLPKGGILADDMGLGKTIQALALIMSNPRPEHGSADATKRKIPAKIGQGTLVVAPLALIKQWESELKDKVERLHKLKVLVHHGPNRTRRAADLGKYEVVITTYQTLSSEHADSSDGADGIKVGVMGVNWYRLILDEAHTIKNRNAKMTKASYALESQYRWCLTGTPMQNNLDELQSLIQFLRIQPYDKLSNWKVQISGPMKNGRGGLAMKRLQYFLKAFMKRRTKDILKKEGALNFGGKNAKAEPEDKGSSGGFRIVARTIEKVEMELSASEREFYDRLESRTERSLQAMMSDKKSDYIGALVLLLRLRQTCNHRNLIKHSAQWDLATAPGGETPRKSKTAGHSDVDDLAGMLGGLTVEARKCDICQVQIPADLAQSGSVRCAECEADLSTLDHQDQDARQPQRNKPKRRLQRKQVVESDDEDTEGEWIVSKDQRAAKSLGKAGGQEDEDAEGGGEWLDGDDSNSDDEDVIRAGRSDRQAQSQDAFSDAEEGEEVDEKSDSDSSDYYQQQVGPLASTKILKLLDILDNETPEHKVIVFSEFTSMLDIIAPFLQARGHKFVRYEGSMRNDEREASLAALRGKQSVRVLLCSLKSGSLGLNLTAASRVVLMEPFWNPFVEEQAIDRVHRLNQTKDVVVYKFTIKGTVEERIIALQEKKRELAKVAIEGGKGIAKLSMSDILALFKHDAPDDHHILENTMDGLRFLGNRNVTESSQPRHTQAHRVPSASRQPVDPAFARRW